MAPTFEQIKAAYCTKDYFFFSEIKPNNINIWVVRKLTEPVNAIDDVEVISSRDYNSKVIHVIQPSMVDSSLWYLKNEKLNPNDTDFGIWPIPW